MKKMTFKVWSEMVLKNCKSSYSLAVCLATLYLWEAGVKNQKEAEAELAKMRLGLSGIQAVMAQNLALKSKPIGFLDKDMVEVSRKKIMTKTKKKTSVQEFADSIKDNPRKIIKWAQSEIREYKKLIRILRRRNK